MADEDLDLERLNTGLRHSLLDLGRRLEANPDEHVADFVMFRLEQILGHVVRIGDRFTGVRDSITTAMLMLNSYFENTRNFVNTVESTSSAVGRPKFVIPREQLVYMLEYDISLTDIAHALGVSKSTIKRRLREYDITVRHGDVLSDCELDEHVRGVQAEFPNAGYRRVYSQLKARSVNVTQSRVREAMHRTDPEGVAMRWLSITPRAVYSVRGPLSLWHIDGNHKLIRWRIVVHGGIDGYTRIPVYLKCGTNNYAETVVQLFEQAVSQYGLPSTVRSDKGGTWKIGNLDTFGIVSELLEATLQCSCTSWV
ncbi:uncharacterized protein LOC114537953 [Dendronephthya gigantea]|uniref:uncharacterized protein LOC114537953 n=1 Tax=Dendronephthya gigantea TaxID=151771 RepID=UPI00106DC8B3|nr:uncharacterized protein LOC114537953 [Dendronephthya gigantea]